jgi:hypothetical protein
VSLLLWSSPCDAPWLLDAVSGRIGRLAPDVTGRDTSLTFTTARASLPASGAADVVGTVVGWFLPDHGDASSDAPRTAKPRPASSASPAKAGSSGSEPPPAASPKPDGAAAAPSRGARPRNPR